MIFKHKGIRIRDALTGILLISCTVPATDAFSFVVIGDTRPPFGSSSYENFMRQIERINSFSPSFVINCGDLIYGYGGTADENTWQGYKAVITAIKAPYHQIPGNHDIFSRKAEKLYTSLFSDSYYSFDHGGHHFVLLDNTEQAQWGYISPEQFTWIKKDLAKNVTKPCFVFMHLPNWIKEKTNKRYYDFWKDTLHPLFLSHKVKAVFAGHIHSYGPTKRFDGIDYYITGGGGAELAKWYKVHGGVYHFMLVKVMNDNVYHSIVSDNEVLNEDQADVIKNVDFDRENASVMSVSRRKAERKKIERFSLSLKNPSRQTMEGAMKWKYDPIFFTIKPSEEHVAIKPLQTRIYTFDVRLINDQWFTSTLPQLNLSLHCDNATYVFNKELVFRPDVTIPERHFPITIDGSLNEWPAAAPIILSNGNLGKSIAEIMTVYDANYLTIGARVFLDGKLARSDSSPYRSITFMVALDRNLQKSEHSNQDMQLEISWSRNGIELYDRSKGQRIDQDEAGIKAAVHCCLDTSMIFEIGLPQSFLRPLKLKKGTAFGIDYAVCHTANNGKMELFTWTPGIEIDGLDEGFQSQLHFADAKLK